MSEEHFEHFDPDLFAFLGDLKANNNREWFNEHKARYEASMREPALAFIRAMGPMLWSISPHFLASDKRSGGSLMRIYRDTRFSKEKRPYKLNLGVQFRHEMGKDVHTPGFYFHIDAEEIFLGVGVWRPDGDAIKKIRARIDSERDAWRSVIEDEAFTRVFRLGGESLKRPPRGYAKDHPLIEDIKRTSFIAVCNMEAEQTLAPGLPEKVFERFEAASGLARFLCDALGVPF